MSYFAARAARSGALNAAVIPDEHLARSPAFIAGVTFREAQSPSAVYRFICLSLVTRMIASTSQAGFEVRTGLVTRARTTACFASIIDWAAIEIFRGNHAHTRP